MSKSDWAGLSAGVVYFLGMFISWTYMIALAASRGDANEVFLAIVFGWMVTPLWPIYVAVKLWLSLWF